MPRKVRSVNTNTKRRKRHRANAKLKHGAAAVRKHMRKSGRTGGIWKKRTHGKHDAQGIETRSAIDAKRRGPKGESPVLEEDAPNPSPHRESNLNG